MLYSNYNVCVHLTTLSYMQSSSLILSWEHSLEKVQYCHVNVLSWLVCWISYHALNGPFLRTRYAHSKLTLLSKIITKVIYIPPNHSPTPPRLTYSYHPLNVVVLIRIHLHIFSHLFIPLTPLLPLFGNYFQIISSLLLLFPPLMYS